VFVDSSRRNMLDTMQTDSDYVVQILTPIRNVTSVELVSINVPGMMPDVPAFLTLDIVELRTPFNLSASSFVTDGFTTSQPAEDGYFARFLAPADCFQRQTATFKTPLDKVERLTIKWVDIPEGINPANQFLLRFKTVQPKPEERLDSIPAPVPWDGVLDNRIVMVIVALIGLFIITRFKRN